MIGSARPWALAAAAAVLVGAPACGDDEEDAGDTTSADTPTRTVTVPVGEPGTETAKSEPEGGTDTAPREEDTEAGSGSSPEDQPGGAGDEEPNAAPVVLTGRGGRVGPLLVRVPPFIAIRVTLRSGDGKPYVVRFRRRVLKAGLKGGRSSATFDGLRPGRRLVGAAVSGRVVIEASAEPGP